MSFWDFWDWLSERTNGQTVLLGLGLAAAIEGFTLLMRFGLGLKSTRDTSWLAPFTLGYRIHHGYIGLLLLVIALVVAAPGWRQLLVAVGVGLIVSDLVHHFLVLWPVTGSPEFHIRYPAYRALGLFAVRLPPGSRQPPGPPRGHVEPGPPPSPEPRTPPHPLRDSQGEPPERPPPRLPGD